MHTDSGMIGISFSGYMPYMTVASLEMSDEPNVTQMERYGRHCEQTYRSNFNRKKSECINWLLFNLSLAKRSLGYGRTSGCRHRSVLHQQSWQKDSAYWYVLVGMRRFNEAWTRDYSIATMAVRQVNHDL